MNIVVLLRAVRDPAGMTVNRKAQKIFINRERYIINPADLNALEAALAVAGSEDMVIALGYGDKTAEAPLYQARAMGAGRALWIRDDGLPAADAGVVTRVIERALEYLGGVDVAALGATVLDADLGQVGARLAEAMGWAFVPEAWALETTGVALRVVQKGPGGFRRLEADMPAVVTVVHDSNKPRYAPAPSIIRVYEEAGAVDMISAAELGLKAEELSPQATVRREAYPPERTWGKLVEGERDDIARQFANALREGAR